MYDPESSVGANKCRGLSSWVDSQSEPDAMCHTRLFLGTVDYTLVALDAHTGQLCPNFGDNGEVKIETSKPMIIPQEVYALSRPAVVNDTVVVGSSVMDSLRTDSPSGRVMAFDARTGEFAWSFDPVPKNESDPAFSSWGGGTSLSRGGANVWSGMSVDDALDLVYLPTTSPSVDFYGGDRPGNNDYANSVVALRGSTGEVVWHQQIVHHDIWDYDLPTAGMLIDYPQDGKMVPALVQNTKQGLIFVFDRATGEPLVPIE